MSNETFMAIAMAVAITAVVVIFIMNTINKNKVNGAINYNSLLSSAMGYCGEIITRVYNVYESLGRIDSANFNSSKSYRKEIIEEVIDIIIEVCDDYGLVEATKIENRAMFTSMAVVVIENVLDMYGKNTIQEKMHELEVQVASFNLQKEAAKENKIEDKDAKVSVELGDFYE